MAITGPRLDDFRHGLLPPQLLPPGDRFLRVPNPRGHLRAGPVLACAVLWTLAFVLALGVLRGQPSEAGALGALIALGVYPVLGLLRVLRPRQAVVGDGVRGSLPIRVRAALVEAQLRRDEETLHQVRSMVAGISLASRVLHGGATRRVPAVKRSSLQDMQRLEIQRLARLVCDEEPEGSGSVPVDLDRVLEPLVVAARTRGDEIRWSRSGVWALGDPDDVAEVVQVLLENAARHAPGSPVVVEVHASEADVTIRVTDSGRGVPPEHRSDVFGWGVRRPDSPGRGIGLSAAHERARALRGSLAFEPAATGGASFVLRLPPFLDGTVTCPAPWE